MKRGAALHAQVHPSVHRIGEVDIAIGQEAVFVWIDGQVDVRD
jgi:hypothetical protein